MCSVPRRFFSDKLPKIHVFFTLQRLDLLLWRQNLEGKGLTAKVFKNKDLCCCILWNKLLPRISAMAFFSTGIR